MTIFYETAKRKEFFICKYIPGDKFKLTKMSAQHTIVESFTEQVYEEMCDRIVKLSLNKLLI